MKWLVVLFSLLAVGCSNLPKGPIEKVSSQTTNVYIMRGWLGMYSEGIDQLATELRAKNVTVEVFQAEQWRELRDAIGVQFESRTQSQPLVLAGFSYGADDAISIARALNEKNIQVDLLITIDPVVPSAVPANVSRCDNYFQSNGFWDIFPWFRGVPLKADDPAKSKLTNADLKTSRKDLLVENTRHATIAGNPKLHREVINTIMFVCQTKTASDGSLGEKVDGSTPAP